MHNEAGSLLTLCWREMDSNHRYPAEFFWLPRRSSQFIAAILTGSLARGTDVRIHLPPRQHDRLQHHPVCARASEDHLGNDQRRSPDLFQNNPFEIVALFAWDDKLVDVSDVVTTQKEEYTGMPRQNSP